MTRKKSQPSTPPTPDGESELASFERRLHGIERYFQGFISTFGVLALALACVVSAGLLATYLGAVDAFQGRITSGVETSIAAESSDLQGTMVAERDLAQAARVASQQGASTAQAAAELSGRVVSTHAAGVATLNAFAAPIYATATAEYELINRGQFHTVVIATNPDLAQVQAVATDAASRLNYETVIYRLPDGLYVATYGVYPSADEARETAVAVSGVVKGAYPLNMGEACPIVEPADGYVKCGPKVNE